MNYFVYYDDLTADQLAGVAFPSYYALYSQPSQTILQTIHSNWSDGLNFVPTTFTVEGNTARYITIPVVAHSSTTASSGIDFSSTGPFSLVLLFVVGTFTATTGNISVTMTAADNSSSTISLSPIEPFVWCSAFQANPLLPNGISNFTVSNPNPLDATVEVRILAL